MTNANDLSRRDFLRAAAFAGAGLMLPAGLATGCACLALAAYVLIGNWQLRNDCTAFLAPHCYDVRDPLDLAVVAASVSPSLVFPVIIVAICLQLFENYLLIPRVMGRTVGTSPLVTLLAITAFGSVLGISGAILAIPMAAIVQLLLYRFWLGAEAQHAAPPVGRDRLSAVRYEVNELIVDLRRLHRVRNSRRPASTERVEDAVEELPGTWRRLLPPVLAATVVLVLAAGLRRTRR